MKFAVEPSRWRALFKLASLTLGGRASSQRRHKEELEACQARRDQINAPGRWLANSYRCCDLCKRLFSANHFPSLALEFEADSGLAQ